MRLAGLRVQGYGPFDDVAFAFDPDRPTILLAPNGAGKSVFRRALEEFFCGVDGSADGLALGAGRLRLTATLADGRTLVRRKGKGATLLEGDQPVPPDAVRQLWGSVALAELRDFFALDTHLLREGGRALEHSTARLGPVLFAAAGGGLGPVRELLAALDAERDAIGLVTPRLTRVLAEGRRAVTDADQALDKVALRPAGWDRLRTAEADAAARVATRRAEREAATIRTRSLERLLAVRGPLARRARALADLAATDAAPEVPEETARQWRDGLDALSRAATLATAARVAAAEAAGALAAAAPEDALLTHPDAPAWPEVFREARKSAMDLPEVAHARDAAEKDARSARRTLGWAAEIPIPDAGLREDARRHLDTEIALVRDATEARRECAAAEAAFTKARADLAALPAPLPEAGPTVADRLAELRAAGDPVTLLADTARAAADRARLSREALAGLADLQPGQGAALAVTAAPSEIRLEAAVTAWDETDRAHDAAVRNAAQARTAHEDTLRTRAALADAALPDPADLADRRRERETLWSRIAAALATPPGAPDAALPLAFDRAQRAADTTADALIAASGRLAAIDSAERTTLLAAAEILVADATVVTAETAVQQARMALDALATAAGAVRGLLPPAFRSFLRNRDRALAAAVDAAAAEADHAAIARRVTAQAAALAGMLGWPPDSPLPALLTEAERHVLAAGHMFGARQTAERALAAAAAALEQRRATDTEAAAALDGWSDVWTRLRPALHRPDAETPAETRAVLPVMGALAAAAALLRDNAKRVADMNASIARARDMLLRIAPPADGDDLDPWLAAGERLTERLRTAGLDAARRETLTAIASQEQVKALDAVNSLVSADTAQAGRRAALCAADDEAAETTLHAISRRRNAAAELRDALAELDGISPGVDCAALAIAAESGDPEAERAELETLAEAAAARDAAYDAALRAARDAEQERIGAQASDAAAVAAADREAARTALARHVDTALVRHAAASLLREALRHGEDDAPPLVRRAGSLFATLTGGGFRGLGIADDSDREGDRRLVALRAGEGGEAQLGELSEGTRDQAFLALRVAALEARAAGGAGLPPLVADDILQTFDDARTEAALRVLVELSRSLQVIVLTHHRGVAEAAARLGDAVHVGRWLGGPSASPS